jgi:hypothetical protein
MMQRASSPEIFNGFLNDPFVRPDVASEDISTLDITSVVANPRNVVLQGDHGGFAFIATLPGIYEVHTVALKTGRGQWIIDQAHAAANYMFTQTDAYEITTRIPAKHVAARTLAIATGMSFEFSVANGCKWRGETQAIDIYSFRVQDWVSGADECIERGRWFHHRLLGEARRIGINDSPHPNDDVHNRYVGASVEMAFAGQVIKAVNFYNRWAICARHPTIDLLALDPPTIKMDIGILRILGDDIEVSTCQ